ncbi:hypothetical protein QAD02_019415 [Eretmocerus hayati]|uniref:Uncharacterized protein n=1 Tax=Eretmocerus hayati TaxID=131215 RepID=A0ACC2PKP2_9HYME|nr:hypothetical protein QAD02_019415 [Eretmocerus hayati]
MTAGICVHSLKRSSCNINFSVGTSGVILEKELMLHEAVITNETEIVFNLLNSGEELNVDCRNNYGRSPIHLAASRGNTDILKMLIDAGCDIELRDKFGMRPIHMAAWYGQQAAVNLLLEAGVQASAIDKKGRSLLMMVAHSCDDPPFLERLIAELQLKQGRRCSTSISSTGNTTPTISLSSSVTSSLAVARDCEGATALHHAARSGHAEAISTLAKLLTEIDLNATDQKGQTPLHYACSAGKQEAACRLQDLGASLDATDLEGCTCLHSAALQRESRLCVRLLSRCSPPEVARLLRLTDDRGYCLIHIAASLGCAILLDSLLQLEIEPRVALELSSASGSRDTPLHLAARNGQLHLVDELVQRGALVRALNIENQTPLQVALELGHVQVSRLLAEAEANPAISPSGYHQPEFASTSADTSDELTSSQSRGDQDSSDDRSTLLVATKASLTSIANIIARTARIDDCPAALSISDE